MSEKIEVAEIIRKYKKDYLKEYGSATSSEQHRAMHAIEICRTEKLGGRVEECDHCGHKVILYNSCRNRHCPKCQALAKARWLENRKSEILPVDYFHIVFTLPHHFSSLALQNKRTVYNIMFKTVSNTLTTIAADKKHLGAEIGFLAVLHTWGQNLLFHPHIHCLVPGGGFSEGREKWISIHKSYFLPVKVLSRLFRRLFTEELLIAFKNGELEFYGSIKELESEKIFREYVNKSRKMEWVVYSKPPFRGPEKLLDYIGRYVNRIAISNERLISMGRDEVVFKWRNYRKNNRNEIMRISVVEFIRRFLLHVVPNRFQRIRYYGFMANACRKKNIERCRKLLNYGEVLSEFNPDTDWSEVYLKVVKKDVHICPKCSKGKLVYTNEIPRILYDNRDPKTRGSPWQK